MRFLTRAECTDWCQKLGISIAPDGKPLRDLSPLHSVDVYLPPSFTQLLWLARQVEAVLHPRDNCLLWMTDWGIFPSNENNHLYYRLRESYGDKRLLHEAPGHLCLDFEQPDVATLLHLCILFGWDVDAISGGGPGRAFVSHDEYIRVGLDDELKLANFCKLLNNAQLEYSRSKEEHV